MEITVLAKTLIAACNEKHDDTLPLTGLDSPNADKCRLTLALSVNSVYALGIHGQFIKFAIDQTSGKLKVTGYGPTDRSNSRKLSKFYRLDYPELEESSLTVRGDAIPIGPFRRFLRRYLVSFEEQREMLDEESGVDKCIVLAIQKEIASKRCAADRKNCIEVTSETSATVSVPGSKASDFGPILSNLTI